MMMRRAMPTTKSNLAAKLFHQSTVFRVSETVKGLKAGRRDLTCENCGRLLFWDEEGD